MNDLAVEAVDPAARGTAQLVALRAIASKTGCTSVGERLIAARTSLVAV
jgi:hypothetical protein